MEEKETTREEKAIPRALKVIPRETPKEEDIRATKDIKDTRERGKEEVKQDTRDIKAHGREEVKEVRDSCPYPNASATTAGRKGTSPSTARKGPTR